ncbi:MAG: hypothetical protein JNL29_01010 [Nitrospira sp.]|nr:hypothetical protein [Nitrospira sp.]
MMPVHWTCWLGTVVGAGCLGWGIKGLVLGPVMDDKRREVERLTSKIAMLSKLANQPPEVRTVEKRVEVPVERVVVKHVEVPVEKIIEKRVEVPIEKTVEKVVDRPVDSPEHLSRIKALEGEVAVILRLLGQIVQLQTVSAQAEGRSSEGRVVVPIDTPEHLDRIKALEGEVAVIDDLRVQIAELQATSVQVGERIAEKSIESCTEKNGERPVDSSDNLARIAALEAEVAEIGELREQIAELQYTLVQSGEKTFKKQAEPPVEKDEKVPVDNLEQLARIKALEGEVAEIAALRAKIVELWESSVQAMEKGAETQGENSTEAKREWPFIEESEHKRELGQSAVVVPSEERAADTEPSDDLKQIRGVGPALERFLHKRGVFWFRQVATWNQADIDKFEFLLPNFGGRIQRENWVRSAQVEHYKKYKQWLGEGEPPGESPDFRAQRTDLQAPPLRAGDQIVRERIEAPTTPNRETSISGGSDQSDEGQADGESPDDLKEIRGVGPALERFLHKRGVFWFSQVATWNQADIDKFEFLLPNFGGRIQRENWVRSAQVEYYKKYKQWLGEGEPPIESLNLPVRSDELQASSSQAGKQGIQKRIENPTVSDEEVRIDRVSEHVVDLNRAGAVERLDQ